MGLNLTTIITGVITSVINAVAIFLATRFVASAIEKAEKNKDKKGNRDNGN